MTLLQSFWSGGLFMPIDFFFCGYWVARVRLGAQLAARRAACSVAVGVFAADKAPAICWPNSAVATEGGIFSGVFSEPTGLGNFGVQTFRGQTCATAHLQK